MHALIVHSPLVGPSTVRPLAASLQQFGWATTVPDARPGVGSPASFRRHVASAAGDATGRLVDVLIGHSGAGAFLPVLAADVGARSVVFVDAVVPPREGSAGATPQLLALLDALPVTAGQLPPWHEWWPAELVARLVPDATARQALAAEMPQVPRSFYDETVPVPPGWPSRPAAYLRLSPAYEEDHARAVAWGWPAVGLSGGHLDLFTRPSFVADHVRRLVDRLDTSAGPAAPA